MKLTEIKDGMEIRVSNNLDITNGAHYVTSPMQKMKGGIYKVRRVDETAVSIYDSNGEYWTFSPDDLLTIKVSPPPPPVMFNTKNIYTG